MSGGVIVIETTNISLFLSLNGEESTHYHLFKKPFAVSMNLS